MGINESMELPLDMIGDGDDDLDHGTMEDESFDLDEQDMLDDEEPKFEIDVEFLDDVEDKDSIGDIKDSVNESLDWFRRVNKYN
jgi:hypothetical protein